MISEGSRDTEDWKIQLCITRIIILKTNLNANQLFEIVKIYFTILLFFAQIPAALVSINLKHIKKLLLIPHLMNSTAAL